MIIGILQAYPRSEVWLGCSQLARRSAKARKKSSADRVSGDKIFICQLKIDTLVIAGRMISRAFASPTEMDPGGGMETVARILNDI